MNQTGPRSDRRPERRAPTWHSPMLHTRRNILCPGCTNSMRKSFADAVQAETSPGVGTLASSHRKCLLRPSSVASKKSSRWYFLPGLPLKFVSKDTRPPLGAYDFSAAVSLNEGSSSSGVSLGPSAHSFRLMMRLRPRACSPIPLLPRK
jgi:hypothetical protein